jgi:hypothetical protein
LLHWAAPNTRSISTENSARPSGWRRRPVLFFSLHSPWCTPHPHCASRSQPEKHKRSHNIHLVHLLAERQDGGDVKDSVDMGRGTGVTDVAAVLQCDAGSSGCSHRSWAECYSHASSCSGIRTSRVPASMTARLRMTSTTVTSSKFVRATWISWEIWNCALLLEMIVSVALSIAHCSIMLLKPAVLQVHGDASSGGHLRQDGDVVEPRHPPWDILLMLTASKEGRPLAKGASIMGAKGLC